MVPIKPHSVTVSPVTQSSDSNGILNNPVTGSASASIDCFIEQLSANESYERYGVVLRDKFVLICELADVANFTPNAIVIRTVSGAEVQYSVDGNPERYDSGTEADHAEVYLTKLQYKDPNA